MFEYAKVESLKPTAKRSEPLVITMQLETEVKREENRFQKMVKTAAYIELIFVKSEKLVQFMEKSSRQSFK